MRSFLLHITNSEALAESGLKVVAYFDALVEHRATLEACVRAAAALSQCVAGLRGTSSAVSLRFNRRGLMVDGPPHPTVSRAVRIGDTDLGEVWLEREEGPDLLDELIVERLAAAAGVLWRTSPRPSRNVAGLIEHVVSPGTAPEERSRALGLLGLSEEQPLDVAAVSSPDPDRLAAGLAGVYQSIQEEPSTVSRRVVCSALLGSVGAVLMQPGPSPLTEPSGVITLPGLPAEFLAGIARGRGTGNAADAWEEAQTAMQFCGLLGFGDVVDFGDLGSLAMLARHAPSASGSNPDVRAIADLATTSRGRAVVETLEKRLATGSIRGTAVALYLHHSSVRYRLRQAEESLGLSLENPHNRLRAELALVLWRLSTR
jgi:hypothetical protein